MMNYQLPNNYTARQARMEDLQEIHRLEAKKSLHYQGVHGITFERLLNEYQLPGFDPRKSVRLVENKEGVLVALVEVWDETDPPVHPYVWLTVDTDYEEIGLEDYLLAWAEERCLQVFGRLDPGLRVAMRSGTNHQVESVRDALQKAGMKEIRHSFRMLIEMDKEPPAPVWPDSVHLRPYNPETDARMVFEADDEVFQDHFGYVKEEPEKAFERFMHHMAGDGSYDPDLWFLAAVGEEIVGVCLCRRYGTDDTESGYVSSLGVKRAWRRRGVAQALLQHAFSEYFRRGKRKVGLGVDAESLTGATALYKKVGMHVIRQYDVFEKILRPGKDLSIQTLEDVAT